MSGEPRAEATPRPYDVALLLCGGVVRALAPYWVAHPAQARPVYAWYLGKIASLNLEDTNLEPTVRELRRRARNRRDCGALGQQSPEAAPPTAPPPWPQDEVDFVAAFAAMGCEGGEGGVAVPGSFPPPLLPGDDAEAAAGLSFFPEVSTWAATVAHSQGSEDSGVADGHHMPSDYGFALILQFLQLCRTTAGDELLAVEAGVALVELLEQQRVSCRSGDSAGSDGRAIDVATLDLHFVMDEDAQNDSVMALGSATKSFHAVVSIAWACAAFDHQAALAATVTSWVHCLISLLEVPNRLTEMLASSLCPTLPEGGAATEEQMGSRCAVNLTETYELLRHVFEGHPEGSTGPAHEAAGGCEEEEAAAPRPAKLSQFFSGARSTHLADNYVAKLLATQDAAAAASAVPREQHYNPGTQLLLQSITNGMLLYVQLYLSLHSLRTALRCAQVAVLVSHQLQSTAALALAHYSSFTVHIASGRAGEAADSVAIALQLSSATGPMAGSRRGMEDDNADDRGDRGLDFSTASLCFAGTAELLLFYPGAVTTSLRALLTHDSAGLSGPPYRLSTGVGPGDSPGEAIDSEAAASGQQGSLGGGGVVAGVAARHAGRHTVVVQGIAQAIRNVVWLSEATAFQDHDALDSAPSLWWGDVVASLHRETLLTAASLYGVESRPRNLSGEAFAELVKKVSTGSGGSDQPAVSARRHAPRPRLVLLAEAMRHTAHKMLALQTGRLPPPPTTAAGVADVSRAALTVGADFIAAVMQHYGTSGQAALEHDLFFSSVVQFCALCGLNCAGYAAAAYDGFCGIALRLYRASGLSSTALTCSTVLPDNSMTPSRGQDDCQSPFIPANTNGAVNEETCILAYLQSAPGPEPRPSAATAPDAEDQFWPPDHLLLLSCVQMQRAEVGVYLGYVDAVDSMRDVLTLLSVRCGFVFGVFAGRYVQLLAQHARSNHAAVVDAADTLLSSLEAIGLRCLVAPVLARKVTALSSAGHWVAALDALDRLGAAGVPATLAPWYRLSRLTIGHEVLLAALGDSAQEKASALLQEYLDQSLSALVRHGHVDGRELCTCDSLALRDAIALQSALARLFFSSNGAEAAAAKVRALARLLASRHHAIGVFPRLLNADLSEVCEEALRHCGSGSSSTTSDGR